MSRNMTMQLSPEEFTMIKRRREDEKNEEWTLLMKNARSHADLLRKSTKQLIDDLTVSGNEKIVPALADLIASVISVSDKEGDDILLLPIDTKAGFNFSPRTIRALQAHHIEYVGDLVLQTPEYLSKKVPNIGYLSMGEIEKAIKLNGLEMGLCSNSEFTEKWKNIRPTL